MKLKDLIILTMALGVTLSAATNTDDHHVPGRLLVLPRVGVSDTVVAGAIGKGGARLERKLDRVNVHVLQVPDLLIDQISAALQKTGLFTFVERDFTAKGGATAVNPNDPSFPSQWHLTTIQAPYAWSLTTGTASVPIAIVDSGVDGTHPDLASQLIPGWNFLTGTSNTSDVLGHGTAVAGTAAAATNNGIGVAGVSWNNKIMPLVVLDSSDSASYSNIASAITYAADHGVRIINVSIGGSAASSTLQNAVDYAWSKGSVVFAAAMNNSTSAPYYPAACNHAVSVSATEPADTLATFSNYGSSIDLSAPGDNILTTMNGGGYGYWYGTSFSSPIAATTAALVLSLKPGLSASDLVSLLEQNSDDLGAAGWDQYFGYGRVNAYKAVIAAATAVTDTVPPSVSITSPTTGATVSGNLSVQGTAIDNVGVTAIQVYVDGQILTTVSSSPFAVSWNTGNYANGNHTLQVTANDAAGNVGTASVSVTVNNVTVKDTTPPTVSVTNPVSGASIARSTNNLTISATASDNVAVSQVSFYIDNVLRCTDTSAPYTCTWNTRKADSGTHTIQVTAWDRAGNSASATETVYKQ